jgi:hypothetical protein
VNAVYEAVLGRQADIPGLGGWVRGIETGAVTWHHFVGSTLAGNEFGMANGTLTDRQFVELLYRNTTGNANDTAGVNWWTDQLIAGVSRTDAAISFSRWEFHVGRMLDANPLGHWVDRPLANELAAMYEVALNRLPERDGFEFWINDLQRGAIGTADLAVLFGRADEFQGRFSGINNRDFVRELYLTVLDRAPDQEGFDFWVGHLERGTLARADMVRGFSVSDEMRGNFGYLPPLEPFL